MSSTIPENGREAAALILRVLLGAWFALSGCGKVFVSGLERFSRDVANYRILTEPWSGAIAHVVPWVEIAGGVCLMLGLFPKTTLRVMTGLVVLFAIAVGSAWARNSDISCGCFGTDAKMDYRWKAAELAGYLGAFGFLWWVEIRKRAGWRDAANNL